MEKHGGYGSQQKRSEELQGGNCLLDTTLKTVRRWRPGSQDDHPDGDLRTGRGSRFPARSAGLLSAAWRTRRAPLEFQRQQARTWGNLAAVKKTAGESRGLVARMGLLFPEGAGVAPGLDLRHILASSPY